MSNSSCRGDENENMMGKKKFYFSLHPNNLLGSSLCKSRRWDSGLGPGTVRQGEDGRLWESRKVQAELGAWGLLALDAECWGHGA